MVAAPELKKQKDIDKELTKAVVDFEREIESGFEVNNRQSFAEYAQYVLNIKEKSKMAKHRTLVYYKELLVRINQAIGHMKLTAIRPKHLNDLYVNLGERGIRKGGNTAIPKTEVAPFLKAKGYTRAKIAEKAGISASSVSAITLGRRVSLAIAELFCAALEERIERLFDIENNDEPLSAKSVYDHHKLIRIVLNQAEREMLIPYNAATKATPPKLSRREASTLQPDDVIAMREALENEPIKWKAYIYLLLVSGCRRGEIAGLEWNSVSWENSQVTIKQSLLYSKERGIYIDTAKNDTSHRTIKLPIEVMTLLREYKYFYQEMQIACADKWHYSGFLFVKDNGLPMHPDSLNSWLRKFTKRHNLPHINPHRLRHTMASLLIFGGVDSVSVSKRLGHARVSTTTDIYSHAIERADELASECIADSILRTPTVRPDKLASSLRRALG